MSNDAQMGIVRILRPFTGFETRYEGVSALTPVMFTEPVGSDTGGQMLDPNAGQPGYSPRLVSGVATVPGQRVTIWLPAIDAHVLGGASEAYNYAFWWRYRNAYDYRNSRIPYHFPNQQNGVPDTTVGIAGPRIVIPAAAQSIVFVEAEVGTVDGRSVFNLRANDISPREGNAPFVLAPLVVDSAGATQNGELQQGLLDPNSFGPLATMPLYNGYDLVAMGDELLVGAYRLGTTGAQFIDWNFSGGAAVDSIFSRLFGTGSGTAFPNTGVYIEVGKAP